MKILIVDDEKLALHKMERLLRSKDGFDVNLEWIRIFQRADAALDAAGKDAPDVAFLDIEMPGISGFELAEQLLNLHPQLQIVFVTAYHDFALKAFEINALDYLLKPVHRSRLAVTMNRLAQFPAGKGIAAGNGQALSSGSVCCFRSLHYRDGSQTSHNFPWKTLKAPELFAYLVYYRDKTVGKQTLMDLLWPDYDMKKATTQLHTAVYQIRQMIKAFNLDLQIKYQDEGYRLIWGSIALDTVEWERRLSEAPPVAPETIATHLSILKMYTGDYLEEHRYIWAEPEQERLRLLWLEHAKDIAECHSTLGQQGEAMGLYQQILEKFPYMEYGYAGLMNIYASLHRQVEVRSLYHQMTKIFSEEYGVSPSREITKWYQDWEEGNMSAH